MNESIESGKKTLFISYSSLDEDLCRRLYDILNKFLVDSGLDGSYEVFRMTDHQLRESDEDKWRNKILINLEKSISCIVLYTVNSIKSQWVHFEIGYAQAKGKNIHAFVCDGIDIDKLIIREQDVHRSSIKFTKDNRFSTECFQQFLESIFKVENDDIKSHNTVVRKFIPKWIIEPSIQEMVSNFLYLCNTKQIYVVGSYGDEGQDDKLAGGMKTEKLPVDLFVEKLVDKLYDSKSGFVFSSFPTVPHIGRVVMSRLVSKIADNNKRITDKKMEIDISEHYSISGLYKMENETLSYISEDKDKNIWNTLLLNYRKEYLRNKNCMIVIGGSKNTEDEYEATKCIPNLQVFPIPCFGGSGNKFFRELKKNPSFGKFSHPCANCTTEEKFECVETCQFLSELVKRFKQYKTPLDKKINQ